MCPFSLSMFKLPSGWTTCNPFQQYINIFDPALITTLTHISTHDLTISTAPLYISKQARTADHLFPVNFSTTGSHFSNISTQPKQQTHFPK